MVAFAQFYVEFLWNTLKGIGSFFAYIGKAFYRIFGQDVALYFQTVGKFAGDFGFFGWVFFIITSIINGVLVFFLVYRLVQLIRRYIASRAKEVDRDKLMEEIAKLREQADRLTKEKEQIFALKVQAGQNMPTPETDGDGIPQKEEEDSRFLKLVSLDRKYDHMSAAVPMNEEDMIPLDQIVKRFVNFAASKLKLYYTTDMARLYISALATSKIIILQGKSGTGKSTLPYAMGKFFNNNTASVISVQPSWKDKTELIGYYNEFTKHFVETPFLGALYESALREDPNFIVLDEMNLSRVEYYFADFLTMMEMPDKNEWKIDLVQGEMANDPKLINYGKLLVPQNVWFVGTANKDDSTFAITDKVYDRAVTITLGEQMPAFAAPATDCFACSADYLQSLFDRAQVEHKISEANISLIRDLDMFLRDRFKVSFGNRIMKQIREFVPVYMACGGTELDGIDFMISSKILRKFDNMNTPVLARELTELLSFLDRKFGRGVMKYSIAYIRELQRVPV